ncbi:MAG: AAA family ATPase [Elusimicrobiales bacterium]
MINRNIKNFVHDIIMKYNKMAFISGPRQTGKTTLAKSILKDFLQGVYFNWDIIEDQKKITNNPYFFQYENIEI